MIVHRQVVSFPTLDLDCGENLSPVEIAYESYGELNAAKTNGILILHAFSGDAHAAGAGEADGGETGDSETGDSETGATPGWWDNMIGPGKAFDTDRYFVLCSNVLGGCSGSTGPASIDARSGKPFGSAFPEVTIADMVRLQKMLIDHLGIERLLTVAGGSMGGMQALQWATAYPDACASVMPIATTHRHSAQQIAFNEVGRQSIVADPGFQGGDYYDSDGPVRGLAVARMIGHITYMSDDSMREKFGRRRRTTRSSSSDQASSEGPDIFEVESYLRYRGGQFVSRFDANSYLVITRAMDTFDLAANHESLGDVLERHRVRFLVISFTSDWLYPSYQSQEIVRALRGRNMDVAYVELPSQYGHDAFLVEASEQTEIIRGFLANTFKRSLEPSAGAA